MSAAEQSWWMQVQDPMRRVGFYFMLAFLFIRFSAIHEFITFKFGFRTFLPYFLGVPAVITLIASGGVRRALQYRTVSYWLAFSFWLVLAIPTSTWKGGSTELVISYWRTEFPMLFLVAGLAMTWQECRKLMYAVALSGLFNLAAARYFGRVMEDRLELEFGTIANANDLAAQLLLIVPFMLFVFFTKKFIGYRVLCVLAMSYATFLVLSTGSRGALVTLFVCVIFFFIRASGAQRLMLGALAPILLVLIVSTLPERVLRRFSTLVQERAVSEDQMEAIGSMYTRSYLLATSLNLTLHNPIFGVGPGQFSDNEGRMAREAGRRGSWQVSHNSYTQVSSEAGVPALIFFLAAIGSSFTMLRRVYNQARGRPEFREMMHAANCLMLSLVTFAAAIFFLSLAYRFFMPALCGISVALAIAASHDLSSDAQAAPPQMASSLSSMPPQVIGPAKLTQPPFGATRR